MPTYEYRCPKCGTEFEVVQKISAKPGAPCPKCRAKAERQLSGGAGLVFKGSGFYLTDYGRAGQKKKSDASSEPGGSAPAAPAAPAKPSAASTTPAAKPTKAD